MNYTKHIIHIWENENRRQLKFTKHMPLLYENLKPKSLLFIGLNASFSEKGFKKILKDSEFSHLLEIYKKYYCYKEITDEKLKTILAVDTIAKDKHVYYQRFKEISKQVNVQWEHIDLLAIRGTKQSIIEDMLRKRPNIKFFNDQINLSIQIMSFLKPMVIVVNNAFASRIIKTRLEGNLNFCNTIGTYIWNINRRKIPIFFTSMLTGQRALDNGSLERLIWQIKFVLNKHN